MNEEILAQIKKINEEINEISTAQNKLKATIADDLNKLVSKWKSLRNKRSELAVEFIDNENLLNMLLDVETAKIIYELGWDNGSGVRDFEKTMDKHIKTPYLSFGFGGWCVEEDYTIRVPKLMVPPECNEDNLIECAEVLKKLFISYIELSGKDVFGVGIFEDTLSEYGVFNLGYDFRTDEYYVGKTVYGSFREISERASLMETLEYISENVFYSNA